ncbi:hypothetical protein DCC79_08345 [bacterium]|nr:MAG: hypothetical protein DCC79_08345 [bacterium]
MTNVAIDREQLAAFCLHNHIVRLSLFGSVLRSDFNPDSDIDILVEFAPHHIPGLLGIARMERELSLIFGGRKVDLRTANDPDGVTERSFRFGRAGGRSWERRLPAGKMPALPGSPSIKRSVTPSGQ